MSVTGPILPYLQAQPCPTCGACPTCGRVTVAPYRQWVSYEGTNNITVKTDPDQVLLNG